MEFSQKLALTLLNLSGQVQKEFFGITKMTHVILEEKNDIHMLPTTVSIIQVDILPGTPVIDPSNIF